MDKALFEVTQDEYKSFLSSLDLTFLECRKEYYPSADAPTKISQIFYEGNEKICEQTIELIDDQFASTYYIFSMPSNEVRCHPPKPQLKVQLTEEETRQLSEYLIEYFKQKSEEGEK